MNEQIQLLIEAVELLEMQPENSPYTDGERPPSTRTTLLWKRVSKYIEDHGGFHFGNATCKKKYLQETRV